MTMMMLFLYGYLTDRLCIDGLFFASRFVLMKKDVFILQDNIILGEKDGSSFNNPIVMNNLIEEVKRDKILIKIWSGFFIVMFAIGLIVFTFDSVTSFLSNKSMYSKFVTVIVFICSSVVMVFLLKLFYNLFFQSDKIIHRIENKEFTYSVLKCINKETRIGRKNCRSYSVIFDHNGKKESLYVPIGTYEIITPGHYYNVFYIRVGKSDASVVKFTTCDSVLKDDYE